jgi:hypothetical protein
MAQRLTWISILFLFAPVFAAAADYSLGRADGSFPQLTYFNKNGTQKTVARTINHHFRGSLRDPALKKGYRVESLLRLQLEGLRVDPDGQNPKRLRLTLVGQYAEIYLRETVDAVSFQNGDTLTLSFAPLEKKIFGLGSGTGYGSLTLRYLSESDSVQVVRFVTGLHVKALFANERDGATLENATAHRGHLEGKPFALDW